MRSSNEALSSIFLSRYVDDRRESLALRNAHEQGTSDVAEKLLHILSSNPQNVLLMAEAGYF